MEGGGDRGRGEGWKGEVTEGEVREEGEVRDGGRGEREGGKEQSCAINCVYIIIYTLTSQSSLPLQHEQMQGQPWLAGWKMA